jgi:catechol 2,3-dioxygenase-like lactoylglutathione lyase family enzyme
VIHHVALRVADVERSRAFYSGLLGLRELRRFEDAGGALRSVWLSADPAVLMLETQLKGAGPEGGSGHVLALAVDSLHEWEERLQAARVRIEDRTAYTLYCRDPDGHRVGLSVYRFDSR